MIAMPSDEELYGPKIAELVERYGEVPPLWAYFPRVHPVDMCWREGAGESYKALGFGSRKDWERCFNVELSGSRRHELSMARSEVIAITRSSRASG